MHWLHTAYLLGVEFSTCLNGLLFFPYSYLTASGILEQITRKCLMIREPIEHQQSLLLPLLAMIGFLTKISEISTRETFMSIVKSTEIFGTITLLYKTMSLGELRCSRFSHRLLAMLLFARNSKRKKVLIECNNKPLKMIQICYLCSPRFNVRFE